MSVSGKVGYFFVGLIVVLLSIGVSSVSAVTITSPSYKIDGNFGGSFGGQVNSTSYKMTSIGGEAIVGAGSSGSYIIDQQQSSFATPSMQLTVQPSGLVGYYPMDENTGTTTADASRYQNNGTLRTPAAWNGSGKLGAAIDFNGGNVSSGAGAVTVADHTNLPSGTQMTFETWINSRSPGIVQSIATNSTADNNSWRINQADNDVLFVLASSLTDGGTNSIQTTSDVLTANTWIHIAAVYDGSLAPSDRGKIYINGVLAATSISGTLPSSLQNSTAAMVLGGYPSSSFALDGSLDHVKLFNRALTSEEISAEYSAQNAGIGTGLALGTVTNESKLSLVDAIVRTNVGGYSLAIQQDHDLQNGANTIPAISGGSIASPLAWSDGVTKGFGFTLMNAPNLDSKWGSGANYAAAPSSATTFYINTTHVTSNVDVINARLRLDTDTPQVPGSYTNNITYTGTMIP